MKDKQNRKERVKNGSAIGGVVFVGCMFIGAGIGKIYGDLSTGGLFGMGVGFVTMGIIWAYYSRKDK